MSAEVGDVGFFTADASGLIEEAGPVFWDLVGGGNTKSTDCQLTPLHELVFPGDSQAAAWQQALGAKGSRFTNVSSERDGNRWYTLVARVTQSGMAGCLHDVSSTHEQLERQRALVDNSPFALVIIQDGIIAYANEAQERLAPARGRSVAAVLDDGIHPEDRELVAKRIRAREGGAEIPTNYRYRTLIDGEDHWHEVWSSRIVYMGRPAVQAFSRDVTEIVALEEQVRHSQKMDAIGQLAAAVAHDFNNLLTVIVQSTDLAKSYGDGTLHQELSDIEAAADRAAQLTQRLLAFSRRQPTRPVVFRIDEALSQIRRLLERLVGERVTIEIDPPAKLHQLRMDAGQFEQIITNLIVNARDAMPDGGVIHINCETAAGPTEGWTEPTAFVEITVADTGSGIEPVDMPRVFEPFFSKKPQGNQGTGIGLSTVQGIVRGMSGTINLRSTPGEGTSVTVRLPLWTGAVPEVPKLVRKRPPATGKFILIVEDEDAVRRVMARLLGRAGFRTHAESNGADALTWLGEHPEVDMVLSDVVMPGISGVELEAEIRLRFPRLPVVLMTGYASEDVIPADHPGIVLSKPLRTQTLVEAVTRAMGDSDRAEPS